VVDAINRGDTARAICDAFEKKFRAPLAKSSLNRWRNEQGNELAQEYRRVRYQVTQLLQELQPTGIDKLAVIIAAVEDRLLTAMRDITAQDPLKLVTIRQRERDRQLKEQAVEIKEQELEFRMSQARAQELLDPSFFAAEPWRYLIFWIYNRMPHSISGFP
jgi:hypothetical protein